MESTTLKYRNSITARKGHPLIMSISDFEKKVAAPLRFGSSTLKLLESLTCNTSGVPYFDIERYHPQQSLEEDDKTQSRIVNTLETVFASQPGFETANILFSSSHGWVHKSGVEVAQWKASVQKPYACICMHALCHYSDASSECFTRGWSYFVGGTCHVTE